jgi:hypothetical protein
MLAGGEEDVVRRMFSIPVIGVSGKDKKGVLANFGNTNEIENNA